MLSLQFTGASIFQHPVTALLVTHTARGHVTTSQSRPCLAEIEDSPDYGTSRWSIEARHSERPKVAR